MSLEIKPTVSTPATAPIQKSQPASAPAVGDLPESGSALDTGSAGPDFLGGEPLESTLGRGEMDRIEQVALGEQPAQSPAAQEIRNIRTAFDAAAGNPANLETVYGQIGGMVDGVLAKYATELKDPKVAQESIGALQELQLSVLHKAFGPARDAADFRIESAIKSLRANLPAESKPLPKTMDAHIPPGSGVFSANLYSIDADGKHLRQTPDQITRPGQDNATWSYDAHQRYEIQLGTKDGPKSFVFDPTKESPKNLWDLIQSHK